MTIGAQIIGSAEIKRGERQSRKLTRRHYENFTVGSRLLPRRLRQDLANIYTFCRLADDLADRPGAVADPASALQEWETELERGAAGRSAHPLFAALGDTIQRRNLSLEPFRQLLSAFHSDLTKTRYRDWNELRDYTRRSADPVGHLVLTLGGFRHPDYFALSDKICTALQLANHWQDIAADWRMGRLYVPLEDMARFGVTEELLTTGGINDNFRRLMTFEIDRTRRLFVEGRGLISKLPVLWRFQIALYWHGGMAALTGVEKSLDRLWDGSPRLTSREKALVALRAFLDCLPWGAPANHPSSLKVERAISAD